MKSLIILLKNIHEIFPYFYFASICLYFFSRHFTLPVTGPWWSAILILGLGLFFLIQLKYKLRNSDLILGLITLVWSVWMLLAVVSDLNNHSPWILDKNKVLFAKCFVLINFYASINLLIKKPAINPKKWNTLLDWIAIGISLI